MRRIYKYLFNAFHDLIAVEWVHFLGNVTFFNISLFSQQKSDSAEKNVKQAGFMAENIEGIAPKVRL